MNDQDDRPHSLLRRLLGQDQDPQAGRPADEAVPQPDEVPPAPHPAPDGGLPRSPVRPSAPDAPDPDDPHAPLTPSGFTPPPTEAFSPRAQLQRAEEALIALREKMAQIAAEFAEGTLNQAQFDAIYTRYSERRDITERLLARNPDSQAWQSVMRPGVTGFLREHFAARVLSYAIYDQTTVALLTITGGIQLAAPQIHTALDHLRAVMAERGNPGPAVRSLRDGRCVVFVPGDLTTAVVIFSLEPSRTQIERICDIHRDFERANRHALERRDYSQGRMVFPHRALFERAGD